MEEIIIPETIQVLLQEHQPHLWKILNGYEIRGRVQRFSTRAGTPNLFIANERNEQVSLHHENEPLGEAQSWAHRREVPEGAAVAILGIGLGYHVVYFTSRFLDGISRLILVEPEPEVLIHAFSVVNWPERLFLPPVVWLTGVPHHLDEIFAPIGADLSDRKLMFFRHEPTERAMPSAVAEWERELNSCIDRIRAGYMGLLVRGGETQRNVYENLAAILHCHPLDRLARLTPGLPGFVIGGGPSLSKNVHHLVQAAEYGPIIATDTALKPLQQEGIQPDIIVTRDPTSACAKKFESVTLSPSTVLVVHPESFPENVGMVPHRQLVWIRDSGVQIVELLGKYMGGRESITRTTNVGHCAFCIAKLLGCDPIVMVAMDLALGDENSETHAAGTAYASKAHVSRDGTSLEIESTRGIERLRKETVPGWDGQLLPTLAQFKRYLYHLEREIQLTPATVIDATEGGARKNGAVPRTLLEVVQGLSNPTFKASNPLSHLGEFRPSSMVMDRMRDLLFDAKRLQSRGRKGLSWLRHEARTPIENATTSNLERLQDQLAEPWLAVYESDVFRTVVGAAGGRLTHRVGRTNPAPFRTAYEGLSWLCETYVGFLEEALDLLDEFVDAFDRVMSHFE